ncbi:MAG: hypothetical protein HQ402_01585 [Parcubacteria group bacterium]|nr:hypothetical protein [Parcubacteria group bacterium]
MDKWIRENKIASGIILVLVVVLAVVYFNKQSAGIAIKSEFQKKQECSQQYDLANTKIKESGRVFQNDTYTLNEIFYSPKMNTCLYAYTIHTTTDPKEIYTIDDLFGGGVFVGGMSKTAEADFSQKIAELKK